MSDDYEYSVLEPFFIDNGELDGLPPQTIFALGVEWEMVRSQLAANDAFTRMVHRRNLQRIKMLCIRQKRQFKVREWQPLDVGDLDVEAVSTISEEFIPLEVLPASPS
jgi:hypothetical protein